MNAPLDFPLSGVQPSLEYLPKTFEQTSRFSQSSFFVFPLSHAWWEETSHDLLQILGCESFDRWKAEAPRMNEYLYVVSAPPGSYHANKAYYLFRKQNIRSTVASAKRWLRWKRIETRFAVWRHALDPFDPEPKNFYLLVEVPLTP